MYFIVGVKIVKTVVLFEVWIV